MNQKHECNVLLIVNMLPPFRDVAGFGVRCFETRAQILGLGQAKILD